MLTSTFLLAIGRAAFYLFRRYFELLEDFLRLLDPDYKRPKYFDDIVKSSTPKNFIDSLQLNMQSAGIEDRIKKIDEAKENLLDAISAIDDLRNEADFNKRSLADAIEKLNLAEQQKQEISKQVDTLKQVANADTEAFRQVMGIPSKKDIWKERMLGFGSGVFASFIASFLYLVVSKVFNIS